MRQMDLKTLVVLAAIPLPFLIVLRALAHFVIGDLPR